MPRPVEAGSAERTVPAGTPAGRRMSPLGLASLAAVGLVLFFVTVPRLFRFARRENEWEALHTTRLLAAALERGSLHTAGPEPTLDELIERAGLGRELRDVEFFDGGHVMRHHGYLFRLEVGGGGARLVAWPWRHGLTGTVALAATAWPGNDGATVLGHENSQGRWSGFGSAPDPPPAMDPTGLAEAGWRPVRR